MRVSYKLVGVSGSRDVNSPCFFLTNKKGGFFSLGNGSRYSGGFFKLKDKLYKVIEDISTTGNVKSVSYNLCSATRQREQVSETFFMPHSSNSLVYQLDKENFIELALDIRHPYDNSEDDRHYFVFEENGVIVVRFLRKKHDDAVFLAIRPDNLHYELIDNWVQRRYEYDKERSSFPCERWVYDAMKIKASKIVFSVSHSKEKAISEAKLIFNKTSELMQRQKKYYEQLGSSSLRSLAASPCFLPLRSLQDSFSLPLASAGEMKMTSAQLRRSGKMKKQGKTEAASGRGSSSAGRIAVALSCAKIALDSLAVNHGLYAGLPWFFQEWSRDELVSLKALMIMGEKSLVKNIVMKSIGSIMHDGRLPVTAGSSSGCADGLGWLFFRINDALKSGIFTGQEKDEIVRKLEFALASVEVNCQKNGLFFNNPNETWMDSISRDSFRLEIQALMLASYNALFKLTKNGIYKRKEDELRKLVMEKFWNGKMLADGVNDFTVRPNVFIAYYVYPQLLSRKEWALCFDSALQELWLDWGGLSTIGKSDSRFRANHSGENPESYHNGDSWYWINNLAAICMAKLNKKKFCNYIKKIVEASANDILWSGALGCHSELSSANKQTSQGCLNQAWSNALFVELCA